MCAKYIYTHIYKDIQKKYIKTTVLLCFAIITLRENLTFSFKKATHCFLLISLILSHKLPSQISPLYTICWCHSNHQKLMTQSSIASAYFVTPAKAPIQLPFMLTLNQRLTWGTKNNKGNISTWTLLSVSVSLAPLSVTRNHLLESYLGAISSPRSYTFLSMLLPQNI